MTADADGRVSGYIDMSTVPIGRHVLVLSGVTAAEEPVRYYQFIEVWFSRGDADGDGISNADDPCTLINHWYDEQTGEDQCLIAEEPSAADKVKPENNLYTKTPSPRFLSMAEKTAHFSEPPVPELLAISNPKPVLPENPVSKFDESRPDIINTNDFMPMLIIIASLTAIGGTCALIRIKRSNRYIKLKEYRRCAIDLTRQ